MENKNIIFQDIYRLLLNFKTINDNVLLIKNINNISITLNKLKSYKLNYNEKKELLIIVDILNKERKKLNFVDRTFNKIDCWLYIDFDIDNIIDELRKKETISKKEFNDFIIKLKSKKVK